MRKLFLLIPALVLSMMMGATVPTITIDGNKSDWSEVPMLTQPGTWPMIKVLPAADANLGTNALVYMVGNTEDFDPTWAKYPKAYIDKDYNKATDPIAYWAWPAMGADYQFTIGIEDNGWKDFPVGITEDNKAIEIGIPATYLTDLEEKFGFAMYYNNGAWYCPLYEGPAINPANGLLYKTRSYTTLPGILTAANAFAHQSIGECTDFVDFGLRDNGNDTARWAAFPIELTTPAKFDLTVNVSSSNSWSFEFWVVDVATNEVVQHIDNSGDISSSKTVKKMGVLDLSSVPAGKYMLKVKNKTRYSKVKLYNIILTSQNGSVSNIPCTLVPVKATMSTETCIDAMGDTDTIRFNSPILDQWVKWNIHIDRDAYYNFKLNTYNKYGHNYKISILNTDESLVDATQEKEGDGVNYTTGYVPVSMKKKLDVGDYIIKVQNLVDASGCRITNIEATYEGGAMINVPDTLWPVDALKSEYAFVNEDGELRFTDNDHTGYVPDQYGKWNVHLNKGGLYNFTLNAFSSNSHHYYLYILNTDESQIEKYTLDGSSGQVLNATTTNRELAAGNYIIKIENFTQYSYGRVRKIIANYEGGAVTAIPGQLLGEDALLHKSGSKYMIRTEEGYLKSSNNGNPTSEWAVWNITATAGTMEVKLNLDPVTSSGHNYRIELYEGNELKDYSEELASTDGSSAVHSKGDIDLEKMLVIPADGSYTIKLVNRTQWSSMILKGITFTPYVAPTAVAMSEEDANNEGWISYKDGDAVNVTVTRTLKAGMYNTFCLPFAVSSTQCKAVFGNDVEIYTFDEAIAEGTVLNVTLEASSGIYQGTPVFIRPSHDIVNPTFNNVSIVCATPASSTGTNANLIGTFTKAVLQPNMNILYLGPNNSLYYPEVDTNIKGFRAWFVIHDSASPAPALKQMRIVDPQGVATEINLVETQTNGTVKTIENGQLFIIRDGIHYNVMGARVK